MPQRKYTLEEQARRGEEMYQQKVRPLLEAGNRGKIVAIDVDSGAFEVADDLLTADTRLFARFPEAQIYYVRIGYPAVDRLSYFPNPPQAPSASAGIYHPVAGAPGS